MSNLTRWQRPDLSVWPTVGRLFGLRDELDRLFENPLGEAARGSQLLSVWNPALDLYEDKDNVIVKAELPGMKKEDIEVSLHDGALSISGERKSEEKFQDAGETYRSERFVGPLSPQPSPFPSEGQRRPGEGPIPGRHPHRHASQKSEAAKPKQIESQS